MNMDTGLFSAAAEIMSTPAKTIAPDATIQDAVILLEKERISGIPVVDDDNRLLGMLTEFDLLRAIRDVRLQDQARDFMSTDIVTAKESDNLMDLTDLILNTRVRRVPVLRDDRVVGVISRRDLVFVGHIRQQLLNDLPVAPIFLDSRPSE